MDWLGPEVGPDRGVIFHWLLARCLVIDDPHDAIERLVWVARGFAEHLAAFFAIEIAEDLIVALRFAGWRMDQVVEAEPLAQIFAIEPEARGVVEQVVFGGRRNGATGSSVPSRLEAERVTIH